MKLADLLAVTLLLTACQPEPADGPPADTDTSSDTDTDAEGELGGPDGPLGWIGSPCMTNADCPFEGGTCLLPDEGYPWGMCTQACDQYCPDADGYPVTFCVADADMPPEAPVLGDGACHTRCDFGFFPDSGCRSNYECAVVSRANEPDTEKYACVPHLPSELTQCQLDLAAAGVSFEPTILADSHPSDYPSLTCHVVDPVIIHPPMHGVDLVYYNGNPTPNIYAGCEMAHSLSDTVLDLEEHGVSTVRHIGTYNCRTISGTSTLSEHAFANAIDIYGVDFPDGTSYTLIDDYEDGSTNPVTPGGRFLYDSAQRWFDARYWNIILSPSYNSAHDNHFHVDLTPGGHYIKSDVDRYFGPAPYAD